MSSSSNTVPSVSQPSQLPSTAPVEPRYQTRRANRAPKAVMANSDLLSSGPDSDNPPAVLQVRVGSDFPLISPSGPTSTVSQPCNSSSRSNQVQQEVITLHSSDENHTSDNSRVVSARSARKSPVKSSRPRSIATGASPLPILRNTGPSVTSTLIDPPGFESDSDTESDGSQEDPADYEYRMVAPGYHSDMSYSNPTSVFPVPAPSNRQRKRKHGSSPSSPGSGTVSRHNTVMCFPPPPGLSSPGLSPPGLSPPGLPHTIPGTTLGSPASTKRGRNKNPSVSTIPVPPSPTLSIPADTDAEFADLTAALAARGLQIGPSLHDGRCLFSAFATVLGIAFSAAAADAIRRALLAYDISRRDRAEVLWQSEPGMESLTDWVRKYSHCHEWGGEAHIHLFEELFNIKLNIESGEPPFGPVHRGVAYPAGFRVERWVVFTAGNHYTPLYHPTLSTGSCGHRRVPPGASPPPF